MGNNHTNHPMNTKPQQHPKKVPIQASSANYMGKSKSTSKTPSPPAKPYPAVTRNAPKPTGKTVYPARVK